MAIVTGLTAARMRAIEAASVIGGVINGNNLILTKFSGATVDAGNVRGATGLTGAMGVKGDTGTPGLKGDIGNTGLKGDTGSTGLKGDTGTPGLKGDIGNTGAKGDTGATGLKGDTGAVGPAGAASLQPNTQTVSYTAVLADSGKSVEMNSAGATTFTVPPNSAVAFPIGTVIEIARIGTGDVTIARGAGVLLRSRLDPAGLTNRLIAGQWAAASIRKRSTDEWVLMGYVL